MTTENEKPTTGTSRDVPGVQVLRRIGEGSALLGPELAERIRGFCAAGHRKDLEGLAAEYGVIVRWCVVGGGAWVLWLVIERQRWAIWLLAGGWVVAALRRAVAAAKSGSPEAGSDAPDEGVDDTPDEPALAQLVRDEIGAEKGVHLQVLYPAMRAALPGLREAPDEDLRQALREAGIPVRKSVRVKGVAGRSGVHRDDVCPLPSPEGGSDGVSKAVYAPVSITGDAGQRHRAETAGERQESGLRIVVDPDNPHRHHVQRAG